MKTNSAGFPGKSIVSAGFAALVLFVLSGCSSKPQERQTEGPYGIIRPIQRTNMFDIPSESVLDIKIFIYAKIVQNDIDYGPIDYRKKEYRLIREADFDTIAKELSIRFPGIRLVHGQRAILSDDIEHPNAPSSEVTDGLDYSHSYIYKNNVVMWQIQYVRMAENGREIEVYVTRYRSGMDASGTIYLFEKRGKMWYFKKYKCNWYAFAGITGVSNT